VASGKVIVCSFQDLAVILDSLMRKMRVKYIL